MGRHDRKPEMIADNTSRDCLLKPQSNGNHAPVAGPRLLIATTIGLTIRTFLLPHIRYWRDRNWGVDGASFGNESSAELSAAFDSFYCVNWSRNPLALPLQWKGFKQIRRLMIVGGYDLVHVHTPVASFLLRLAAATIPKSRRPLIAYTAHGFHFHRGRPWWQNIPFLALEKVASSWTDCLITINKEDLSAARRWKLGPREAIHQINGIGVPLRESNPDPVSAEPAAALRSEIGLAAGDHLFVIVAQFDRGKRHIDCIEALQTLGREDVHLCLLGEGPERAACEVLVNRLALSQNVHFLGFRSDVDRWLAASDGLILASEREGLPRCIMEAMAGGTPVIASNIRGNSDLLEGGCGRLFDVGDKNRLSSHMQEIVENPQSSADFIRRGSIRVQAYSIEKVLIQMDTIYRNLPISTLSMSQ